LLEAAGQKKRWQLGATMIRIALLTSMRIARLRWGQVDLAKRCITVEKAKSPKGAGVQIPMNDDLFAHLSMHRDWFQ
jgi:hypothetical protein